MKNLVCITAISLGCMALAGCETMQDRISHKEDMLSAAGFTLLPANTPQRQSELSTLPPNKFIRRDQDDQVTYVYADPVVCDCLYIGTQQAYGTYKQDMFTQRIANEQQMTALEYQNAWDWGGWDWGPWGRGWWWR